MSLPPRLKTRAILAVTLFAPLLDGGSPPWATALIMLLAAAVATLWPPTHSPTKPIGPLLLATAALPALAFLPASLTSTQLWRTQLTETLGIPLASTTTPQPWVTLDAWLVFAAAMLWVYYLAAQRWTDDDRSFLVRGLAIGIAAIATVSLAFEALDYQPPFWTNPDHFGPFVNRNRFATLLAVAAILVATATKEAYDRRNIRWLYWPLVSAPLFAAIISNGSRAGLILFFAGIVVWLIVSLSTHNPSKSLAVGSAVILIFASGFFLFGGELLQRFLASGVIGAGFDSTHRLLIYQDLPETIGASPFVGHGLGNFDSVFTYYRDASLDILRTRVMHPENDFLWLAAEGGIPLLLASLLCLGAFIYRALPLRQSDSRRIARPVRVGTVVACALVLAHGLIDIPAHVPGVFLTFALLAALSLARSRRAPLGKLALPARLTPLPFVITGAIWFASPLPFPPLPTTTAAAKASDWRTRPLPPIEMLDHSIAKRPLDWQSYFLRASALLAEGKNQRAAEDFARSRYLAPESMVLASAEAKLWQSIDPPSAVPAWRFIIEHHEDYSLGAFHQMLEAAKEHPEIRATAEEIAPLRPDLLLTHLGQLPPAEFRESLDAILEQDPALRNIPPDRLPALFQAWYIKGDRERLLSNLGKYPDWRKAGWMIAARDFASKNQFQQAVDIAFPNSRKPPVTNLSDHRDYAELRRDFIRDPTDALTGLFLFGAERRGGSQLSALKTILKVGQLEDAPDYVPYYEAEFLMIAKRWKEAWLRLEEYNRAYPPY